MAKRRRQGWSIAVGSALLAIGEIASAAAPNAADGHPLHFTHARTQIGCKRLLPNLKNACAVEPRFRKRTSFEVLRADLDRDGKTDLLVRRTSLFDCGSHGCTTGVYRGVRGGRLVRTNLDLATYGDVGRCRTAAARPGFAFIMGEKWGYKGGNLGYCFSLMEKPRP